MANTIVVMTPFPPRLMSTARSAAVMPLAYGREVRNLLAGATGTGIKRNGLSAVGGAIAGQTINGIFGYVYNGTMQTLVSVDDGSIRLRNGGSWITLKTGLNTNGVVRSAAFGGKLILCNGYDDLMVWDGAALNLVWEYLTDTSANLTYIADNQFRIDSEVALYPVGCKVRARLGVGVYAESTVSAATQSGVQTTVTLSGSVLTGALDEIAYEARPPKAAFVYAAHDRLWAFGQGPLLPTGLSANVDRMRVYYTFGVNDATAWHDSDGNWQGINLADKSPAQDELMAMSVKDGMTVFFGRNQTQVWTGSDPTDSGDFSWSKTLPLGIVHGEAVLELPNDVAFLTENGMRTLSRSLQTEQLDVSDVGGEIDPTWLAAVQIMEADTGVYRRIRRGRFDAQGWFVISLPEQSPVLQVTAGVPVWTLFDGLFAGADAVGNLPDGTLLLASAGQLYAYDTATWDDAGVAFTCRWWTPWLSPAGASKRWGNYYIGVLMTKQASLPITLYRYRDFDDNNPRVTGLMSEADPDLWDSTYWDTAQWDNANPTVARVRDHFVASSLAVAVEHAASGGPLTILGIKLEGVPEQ